MRNLGWVIVAVAVLVGAVGGAAAAGRVVLLEQTMNVGCG